MGGSQDNFLVSKGGGHAVLIQFEHGHQLVVKMYAIIAFAGIEYLKELISKVEAMTKIVEALDEELKGTRKPYLTLREASAIIGYGTKWVDDHKFDIGCSSVGGQVRFKRKDVDWFMETDYYKNKTPRRKYT